MELLKSEQQDKIEKDPSIDEEYVDYVKHFHGLISQFIIRPFGKSLNQDLIELLSQKLDLNE